jgi:hypothetical protein
MRHEGHRGDERESDPGLLYISTAKSMRQFGSALQKPHDAERTRAEARETTKHADCTEYATNIRWNSCRFFLASAESRAWDYEIRNSLAFACISRNFLSPYISWLACIILKDLRPVILDLQEDKPRNDFSPEKFPTVKFSQYPGRVIV